LRQQILEQIRATSTRQLRTKIEIGYRGTPVRHAGQNKKRLPQQTRSMHFKCLSDDIVSRTAGAVRATKTESSLSRCSNKEE